MKYRILHHEEEFMVISEFDVELFIGSLVECYAYIQLSERKDTLLFL